MSARVVMLRLTEAQYTALALACDEHGLTLMDQKDAKRLRVLNAAWDAVNDAWHNRSVKA